MRYIFMALHAEASPLIRRLHLKQTDGAIRCFQNDDTILALTGTGPLSAAAVTASVLSSRPPEASDLILNAGSAAGVYGAPVGTVFAVNKIIERSSGREYYPDLIPPSSCKEAAVCTGSRLYTGDDACLSKRNEPVLLYDMESAGVMHSASMFAEAHQIRFLKIVTDSGTVPEKRVLEESAAVLSSVIESELNTIGDFLNRKTKIDPLPEYPYDDFHASLTMRRKLALVFRYCQLAGIDTESVLKRFYETGRLPAKDKETGKRVMEDVIHELLP